MQRPYWAPEGVDISRPNMARSYDYWLGGSHNFAVDRQYAGQIEAVMPQARQSARANRAFLQRAVRFMLAHGVRQFLDVGSGIPTLGNVHETAQRERHDTRVVYVDIDPIAVTHSEQILAGNDLGVAIQEDIRDADAILNHAETKAMLDFDQPIGLLIVSVLHVVLDADKPHQQVARLCRALPAGSMLAISHATDDVVSEQITAARAISERTSTPGRLRSRADIERFFDGMRLVDPGLVWLPQWRPDSSDDVGDHPEHLALYAGVGRKS